MDVGVLTTLGSAVGVILSLLGAMAHLCREIRGDIRGDIREVRSKIRILDERLRDLQVDMGIVKHCLAIGGNPLRFKGANRISVLTGRCLEP